MEIGTSWVCVLTRMDDEVPKIMSQLRQEMLCHGLHSTVTSFPNVMPEPLGAAVWSPSWTGDARASSETPRFHSAREWIFLSFCIGMCAIPWKNETENARVLSGVAVDIGNLYLPDVRTLIIDEFYLHFTVTFWSYGNVGRVISMLSWKEIISESDVDRFLLRSVNHTNRRDCPLNIFNFVYFTLNTFFCITSRSSSLTESCRGKLFEQRADTIEFCSTKMIRRSSSFINVIRLIFRSYFV